MRIRRSTANIAATQLYAFSYVQLLMAQFHPPQYFLRIYTTASQDCLNKAIDYNTIAVVLNAGNRKLKNETRVRLNSKAAVKKVNSI